MTQDQSSAQRTSEINGVSRRDALKKVAVGAAVAGVAWNAPRIENLTLRPNYAAAQSGAMMGSESVGTTDLPDEVNIDIDLPFSGLAMMVTDVTLFLDITHTYIGDLEVTLTSPGGTTLLLVNNECNFFPNTVGMQVTLTDSAGAGIGSACSNPALYAGTFRPVSPFSGFAGQDPNGTWVLNIRDTFRFDAGTLNLATLTIIAA